MGDLPIADLFYFDISFEKTLTLIHVDNHTRTTFSLPSIPLSNDLA